MLTKSTYLISFCKRKKKKRAFYPELQTFGDRKGKTFQGFIIKARSRWKALQGFSQHCSALGCLIDIDSFEATEILDLTSFTSVRGDTIVVLTEKAELIKLLKNPILPEYGKRFKNWLHEPWW